MSGKIKPNSSKLLAKHFSTRICKKAKYSVQTLEKCQSNGRTCRHTIGLGEAVLRWKRKTE